MLEMSLNWVRSFCLAMPQVTEDVKWGNDLVFCIAKKMFAVLSLEPVSLEAVSPEPGAVLMAFKCSPEVFAELVERPGIIPAPYLARAYWVALEDADALTRRELQPLLRAAYDQVVARLPKRVQATIATLPGRQ